MTVAGMSAGARPAGVLSHYECPVAAPYRLDLTVSALRRVSTNAVDVLTPGGQYVSALAGSRGPVVARVTQVGSGTLAVALEGDERDHDRALALVRRMLGVDRDLTHFDHTAARIPWLTPLAARMRGVKPPRYATLWEAFVNVIVFQQISLPAASAIMERLIVALGESQGVRSHVFPTGESVLDAKDDLLRAAGLSAGKRATLRRVGEALAGGALDEEMLEGRGSVEAAALLGGIKGIGPWTAAVILLRRLGRLDVFPANDSSVARNLAIVAGATAPDIDAVIRALRPQQGMLYYHLLLARLEARGEVGRPSAPRWSLDRGIVAETGMTAGSADGVHAVREAT
jgi:DNA-3-methyladenine glycosylase II